MSIQGDGQFFQQYTSDGNRRIIQLPAEVNYVEIHNRTQYASTANPGVVKRAWWFSNMDAGTYLGVKNTDGAATDESVLGTTGGFTIVNSASPQVFASTAVSGVTQAPAAVVTSTGHGLQTGDIAHLANITNMQQISGYDFVVTRIDANSFSIPVNTSAFTAPGGIGTVRRREFDSKKFTPRTRSVVGISQAAQAVVNVNLNHTYKVGDVVHFNIPAEYSMVEMNGLEGKIVAVGSDTQFTIDINSTGFTAFTFPTSAQAAPGAGVIHARCVPVGQRAELIDGEVRVNSPTFDQGIRGVELGLDVVGANNDVMEVYIASATEI